MGIYGSANSSIKKITDFLITKDEIKQILYHNDDPFSKNPNLITPIDLIDNNIYKYAKINIPEDEIKTIMCIYLNDTRKAGLHNTTQRDINIFIDILCHEKLQLLNDDVRLLLLMDYIDLYLPTIEIESIRSHLVFVDDFKIAYNKTFQGYRLVYQITNSAKKCS